MRHEMPVPVDETLLPRFLDYCELHGEEHDTSFVPRQGFRPGPDNPAFIMLDQDGLVAGAGALLLGGSWERSGRGRFAFLHSEGAPGDVPNRYRDLVAAAAAAARNRVCELYLFLPESAIEALAALEAIGFAQERVVYGMEAPIAPLVRPEPPAGMRLEAVGIDDEGAIAEFVAVRNRNFKEVLGAHDSSVEDIRESLAADTGVDSGHLILRDATGAPRGTIFLERDDEEGVLFIGTVSVDRAARGRGLGRFLIRYALAFGAERGFDKAFLSVNALNRSALSLYEREGFVLERAMVCLSAAVDALAPPR